MDKNYTYYAFISYKREDEKWAKWLKKKLESYRLPAKLCKKSSGLPKRLVPVFLDKENLNPGVFDEQIRKHTSESKFFISICSRNMLNEPEFVDKELEAFLETHTADFVIPFIVDKSENPICECCSPKMSALCTEKGVIGVSIYDKGAHQALLKTISRMHGLETTALETADSKRIRRNRIFTVFAACCLLTASFFAYNYYAPKKEYFLNYVSVNGLPQGIHPLNEDEIKSMSTHYTIVRQMGKTIELRHENSAGMLRDHLSTEDTERSAMERYHYDDDNKLISISCYNQYSDMLVKQDFEDESLSVVALKAPDGSATPILLPSSTTAMSSSSIYSGSTTSEITGYKLYYNSDGLVSHKLYLKATSPTLPVSDIDGIWGMSYTYDYRGNITSVEYLKHSGKGNSVLLEEYSTTCDRFGVALRTYKYSSSTGDRTGEYYYDSDGNLTANEQLFSKCQTVYKNHNAIKQSYLNAYNSLVNSSMNYAYILWEYDQNGFCTLSKTYNRNNALTAGSESPAPVASAEYNKYGDAVLIKYLNEKNEVVPHSDGSYAIAYEYDYPSGYLTREMHLGKDGSLAHTNTGFSRIDYSFENGKLVYVAYFNADNEPTLYDDDYAAFEYEYENGILKYVKFYDTDKNMTCKEGGYAMNLYNYDPFGNIASISFLNENKERIPHSYGHYSVKLEYDSFGNETKKTFLNASGEPMLVEEYGYASYTIKYDKNKQTEFTYLDENDNPVFVASIGYASNITEYNNNGKILKDVYLDEKGSLVFVEALGYASNVSEYDSSGNMVKDYYLDENGSPVFVASLGYACIIAEYDEVGNLIKWSYLNSDGSPVFVKSKGYASNIVEYDSNGNYIKDFYLDEKGRLVFVEALGYAGIIAEYDKDGNQTKWSFINSDGNPVFVKSEGYASHVSEYFDKDKRTKQTYLDSDSNPVFVESKGYASYAIEYDENGNQTKFTYLDENGSPVFVDSKGYAFGITEYDENGNITKQATFDEKGNPVFVEAKGYASVTAEYDENSKVIKQTRYDENGNIISR